MTSPIKPPGGPPPGAPPPEEISGTRPGKAEPAEAFREVLRGDDAGPEGAARAPAGPNPVEGVASLAEDLKAGRIDVATAVDRIVDATLGSEMARALAPAQRADLEADLRRALADDPTLLALTKDLERGT